MDPADYALTTVHTTSGKSVLVVNITATLGYCGYCNHCNKPSTILTLCDCIPLLCKMSCCSPAFGALQKHLWISPLFGRFCTSLLFQIVSELLNVIASIDQQAQLTSLHSLGTHACWHIVIHQSLNNGQTCFKFQHCLCCLDLSNVSTCFDITGVGAQQVQQWRLM